MVIPRDFHVLDPPRANLARRLNSLIVFLVAILHLYKRLMTTKPVAALLVGARADEDTTWPEGFDPVAAGVTEIVVVAIDDPHLRKSE